MKLNNYQPQSLENNFSVISDLRIHMFMGTQKDTVKNAKRGPKVRRKKSKSML